MRRRKKRGSTWKKEIIHGALLGGGDFAKCYAVYQTIVPPAGWREEQGFFLILCLFLYNKYRCYMVCLEGREGEGGVGSWHSDRGDQGWCRRSDRIG